MPAISDQEPDCFGVHVAKWRQYSSEKLVESLSRQGRQMDHLRGWIQSILKSRISDQITLIDRHNMPASDRVGDNCEVLVPESARTIDDNYN